MGVSRAWTRLFFAPILTFPRKRGKGFRIIQRSPQAGIQGWGSVDARPRIKCGAGCMGMM